jgi:hypothetical protein
VQRTRRLKGDRRGTEAAALEAAGTALGSIGLIAFSLVVWRLTASIGIGTLALASVVWFLVSVAMWQLRRKLP